jgi:hypothetical protein
VKGWSGRLAVVALLWLLAAPLHAQQAGAPVPLDVFVAQLSRLWARGEAERLAEMTGPDGRVMLDLGANRGGVQERHFAAALRSLFNERESMGVRPHRAVISGGSPPRGFVELAWSSRARGTRAARTSTVYVGAVLHGGEWRISELRLLP